jgi:hypothetical protein
MFQRIGALFPQGKNSWSIVSRERNKEDNFLKINCLRVSPGAWANSSVKEGIG